MKCLITGVNGFVGSHLAEYLLEKKINPVRGRPAEGTATTALGRSASNGVNVVGTVYPEGANQNIYHILNKIRIITCNLINPEGIESIIKETTPDIIFHLAGQSNVPLSWQNPAGTFKINVLGTIHLLNAVKVHSPKSKILIIGSSEEYDFGKKNKPSDENTSLMPKNPYALSKLCEDLLAAQIGEYNKLHVVRVRPFPHIGPKQTPNFVVSDFCRQIALIEKRKQPPVLKTGSLKSKRDFTDVRDVAAAYWLAINKGKNGEVYNISSEKDYSVKEILKKLLKLTKTRIKIETDPSKIRLQDTEIKNGSSKKFRKLTGWKPTIQIQKTLEDTLNWWRKQII